jgi:glycosyltransferase involved in cell wall biosynthesis
VTPPALITVVLATYNWPEALDLCLQSLQTQTDAQFEICIADDGSKPDTTALIAQWQRQSVVPIRHHWQEDQGFRKSRILNRAIADAKGEYLVFLDGDCIVQPDFIARHRALAQPGFLVTGARILLASELTQRLCEARAWNPATFLKDSTALRFKGQLNKWWPLHVKLPDHPWRNYREFVWRRIKGCNMAAWRDDVQRIGGFDEGLEGWGHEDADFVFRLQAQGVRRKSGSWSTEVLHLWHRTASKEAAEKNAAIVRAKILAKAQAPTPR